MSDELKPCPFCGEVPETFTFTDTSKWGAVACCCTGPEVRTGYDGLDGPWNAEAVREWNTRPRELTEAELAMLREVSMHLLDPIGAWSQQWADTLRAILRRYGR